MKINRPYKERKPEITINKINQILSALDMNVLPIFWASPYDNIYSVRVEELKSGFGTNGKGTTKLFTLASAYAEFIERLQNLYHSGITGYSEVFLKKLKEKFGFHYYPDEKILSLDSLLNLPNNIKKDLLADNTNNYDETIKAIYRHLQDTNKKGVTGVPFYDLENAKIIYLPYNLLNNVTGSNGMAAGNSLAEATFQALSELFERYVASLVYFNRLTPPTIPKEYIKQFKKEYEIIKNIEKDGKTVIVKDFSCNLSMPVVGLIIVDNKTNKYRLNIGTDTCFKIALSRTLTEILQGTKKKGIESRFFNLPNPKETPFFFNKKDEAKELINYRKFVISGDGIFPPSLFKEKESYKFDPNIFKSRLSYEEETKYLLSIAKKHNLKVYLRNVSFLDFPTVYLYIPSVSKWGKKTSVLKTDVNINNYILTSQLEETLFPVKDFINSKNKIKKITKILEKMSLLNDEYDTFKTKALFRLEFIENSIWDNLSLNFFNSILYFLIEDYTNAKKHLKIFLKNKSLENNDYYKKVLQYFTLLEKNEKIPKNFADLEIEFKNADSIFKYIGLPNCPDCNNCVLSKECLTRINLEISNKINYKFKNAIINQHKFFQFR